MNRKPQSWVLLILVAFLLGCPKQDDAAPPLVDTCTEVGERCLHSPGKMGVCNEDHSLKNCATPPCLVCMSQH